MLNNTMGITGDFIYRGNKVSVLDSYDPEGLMVTLHSNSPRASIVGSMTHKQFHNKPYYYLTSIGHYDFLLNAQTMDDSEVLNDSSIMYELISLGGKVVHTSDVEKVDERDGMCIYEKRVYVNYLGVVYEFKGKAASKLEQSKGMLSDFVIKDHLNMELDSNVILENIVVNAFALKDLVKIPALITINSLDITKEYFLTTCDGIYFHPLFLIGGELQQKQVGPAEMMQVKSPTLLATKESSFNKEQYGLEGWIRLVDFTYLEGASK